MTQSSQVCPAHKMTHCKVAALILLIMCAHHATLAKAVNRQDELETRPGSNSILVYSVSVLSGLLLVDLVKKRVLMPLIVKGEWGKDTEEMTPE
jgi:hypothetical protein